MLCLEFAVPPPGVQSLQGPRRGTGSAHATGNISQSTSTGRSSSGVNCSPGVLKLYEMGEEPERRPFLDRLTAFNEERGTTISSVPTISKQPLDLFKLYASVRDRGGYKEVTKNKLWKECAQLCNIAISSSAAYTLKKQYTKLLLPYECKFDRNNINPEALISETESVSRKGGKNKAVAPSPGPSDSNSQGSYPQSGTPGSVDHGSSNSYPPPHPSPTGSPYPGPGAGYPPHPSPTSSPYPGPGYPPPPGSYNGVHYPGYPSHPHHGGHHPHWSGHMPPGGPPPPPPHHFTGPVPASAHHPMTNSAGPPRDSQARDASQSAPAAGSGAGSGGDSLSAQDPFSDDMQPVSGYQQTPQGHQQQRQSLPPPGPPGPGGIPTGASQGPPAPSGQAPNSQPGPPPPTSSNHAPGGYPNSSGGYPGSNSSTSSTNNYGGYGPPGPHGPSPHERGQYPERAGPGEQYPGRPGHPGAPHSGAAPHHSHQQQGPGSHYAGNGYPPGPPGPGGVPTGATHGPPPPSGQAPNSQPGPPPTSSNQAPSSYPNSSGGYPGSNSSSTNNYGGYGPPGPHGPSPHERGQYPERPGPGEQYSGRPGHPGSLHSGTAPHHSHQQQGPGSHYAGNGYPPGYGRSPQAAYYHNQQQRAYGEVFRDGRGMPTYDHPGRPDMGYGQAQHPGQQQGPSSQNSEPPLSNRAYEQQPGQHVRPGPEHSQHPAYGHHPGQQQPGVHGQSGHGPPQGQHPGYGQHPVQPGAHGPGGHVPPQVAAPTQHPGQPGAHGPGGHVPPQVAASTQHPGQSGAHGPSGRDPGGHVPPQALAAAQHPGQPSAHGPSGRDPPQAAASNQHPGQSGAHGPSGHGPPQVAAPIQQPAGQGPGPQIVPPTSPMSSTQNMGASQGPPASTSHNPSSNTPYSTANTGFSGNDVQGYQSNAMLRTYSPLQRLLAKPSQQQNYSGVPPGNQMYPPMPGTPNMPPNKLAAPVNNKPVPYPGGPPPQQQQPGQPPSPSPNNVRAEDGGPGIPPGQQPPSGAYPPQSPYANAQVKRHPDFMKDQQPYPNSFQPPQGPPHGPPPGGQAYPPGYLPSAGAMPNRHQGPGPPGPPGPPSHWNGDARGFPPGYMAPRAGPPNGPSSGGYPQNQFNNKASPRDGQSPQGWGEAPNSRPDASSWGVSRYGHQHPPGTGGAAPGPHGAYGPQGGPPGSTDAFPGSYGGPMHEMSKMGHQFGPRIQSDPIARGQMFAQPPPMTAGSMPSNRPLPPSLPPHLHGPNREPPQMMPPQPGMPYGPGHPQQHHPQQPGGPGMPHPHIGHPAFQQQQQVVKKELTFPPNTVEGTLPKFVKRRRLTSKDLSHIDTGRLLMCLKSGMLAESTWALDVLSVLIYDDSTVMYFGLQKKLPGLLDVLLEHYVKYLGEIFEGIFDDNQVNLEDVSENGDKSHNNHCITRYSTRRKPRTLKKWYEIDKDLEEQAVVVAAAPTEPINCDSNLKDATRLSKSSATLEQPSVTVNSNIPKLPRLGSDDQLVLLNGSLNYTLRSRDGKPVRIDTKTTKNSPIEEERRWEILNESYTSDSGFNEDEDDTSHILTQFESKEKFVHFTRALKDKTSSTTNPKVANAKAEQPKEVVKSPCNGNSATVLVNGIEDSKKAIATSSEADKPSLTTTAATTATEPASEPMDIPAEVLEYPCFRSPKRKHVSMDDLEDEALQKDDFPLCPVDEYCDSLVRRCLCLSTLIRNLSFIQGNDNDMVKHQGLMFVLSRLLLLNHEHPEKKRKTADKRTSSEKIADMETDPSLFNEDDLLKVVDDNNNDANGEEDSVTLFENIDREWYWDAIHLILENSLVTLSNISGQLDMSPFPERISLPLLDGLLHWAVCSSSYAKDHLPTTSLPALSPQRLALEALAKLSIQDGNVDLILATPPWDRLDRFFKQLAKTLSRSEEQTVREFSLVLLGNLAAADTSISRSIALTGNAIPQLISFVEESEQSALGIASSRGINALRENPELMGTTLDMVRRSALCLRHLARIPENRSLFMNFQQRLLALVMSQILDQGVAAIIADVIYECSLSDPARVSPTPFFPTINLVELMENRELNRLKSSPPPPPVAPAVEKELPTTQVKDS